MQRAILLACGIAGALAAYFVVSVYAMPQLYSNSLYVPRPAPLVSRVNITSDHIRLGDPITISVSGTNAGDTADMQIVSVGFPNATGGSEIGIVKQNFRQTPLRIEVGSVVGSGYTGANSVPAKYPSVEASSRPWDHGSTYTIDLQITPQTEGRFVIFVKSVAFPHSWDGAHFPSHGLSDYQAEFVDQYSVNVTKS